jgi:UMF1 family MFS transporter
VSGRDRGNGRHAVFGWALYDWANYAFATVMLAGFFPIFFRDVWSAGEASADILRSASPTHREPGDRRLALSWRDRRLLRLQALLAPSRARRGHDRGADLRRWAWEVALVLFVLSTVGFLGANVFYDALIVSVTSEDRYDVVSALGYALGYLGGGVLFAVCVAMTLWPARFGLGGVEQAVRLSFLLTAVWWAVFAVPLFCTSKRSAGSSLEQDAAGCPSWPRRCAKSACCGWSSCSCSLTGSTSTASTPSSGWRWTTAWRWASAATG